MKNKAGPVVVIGGGGHGKVLLNMLARIPEVKVLGYVDPRDHGKILGFSHLGNDEVLPELALQAGIRAVIGIGKISAGNARLKIAANLRQLGFLLPTVIAPTAIVADGVLLGEGTVVMDGAIVQPGCVVGQLGIINTGAVLDHDCVLGEDVHIAPAATLSGNVTVGSNSMVGVGACVIQGARIGEDCIIGAGAAVVEDCLGPGTTYVGVPARKARQ